MSEKEDKDLNELETQYGIDQLKSNCDKEETESVEAQFFSNDETETDYRERAHHLFETGIDVAKTAYYLVLELISRLHTFIKPFRKKIIGWGMAVLLLGGAGHYIWETQFEDSAHEWKQTYKENTNNFNLKSSYQSFIKH